MLLPNAREKGGGVEKQEKNALTLKGQSIAEFEAIHEHSHMIRFLKLLLLASHHQVCKLAQHLVQAKGSVQKHCYQTFLRITRKGPGVKEDM